MDKKKFRIKYANGKYYIQREFKNKVFTGKKILGIIIKKEYKIVVTWERCDHLGMQILRSYKGFMINAPIDGFKNIETAKLIIQNIIEPVRYYDADGNLINQ